MLIDGHLRAEMNPEALVPVLVLDLTEEEADKLLLSLDPLAAMAESDSDRIKALLATVRTIFPSLDDLDVRHYRNLPRVGLKQRVRHPRRALAAHQ